MIKFALIGYGRIGKRHAEMILANPDAELVAVIENQSDVELDIDVPLFDTIEAFLQSNIAFDVANIATPNGLHAEHALQFLEAKAHVVIEKPMALSKEDAEKVIYKSLQVHRHVFVVMQNRYSPPSEWLKSLIADGTLGDIYMVQINCYWNRDGRYYHGDSWHGTIALDGGTLFTQFSHFIDVMYWLFGDIKNITARLNDFNHKEITEFEDSGMVQFDFVNGGMGCINYSTSVAHSNLESSITIIAQNGSVKVGGQYMDQVEVCNIPGYTMPQLAPTNPGNDYGSYKGSAANHNFVIQNVVDVLSNQKTITTNALEGMKVVDIIERIYEAGRK
ncbi:MAG: Gfo/Idh/MocA family oxidoreductase [Bacteroidetes bacterium]|uniref:Gfo/Idh/MocA family oxidoreductase n=1 Tax=Phaeocystidibacter marisrubri TaxID=1577780 RepID=A0A6L3ZI92_9FLAO|nr:Gfo/Idh/MocA family oxidoreductase [Phaeocystidibacter marisrubri]KAB2817591.1 Gfo/Idh/MocA family oxidoreductase [Phaeocystidibacter marisrubri]TNE29757.1 MAG: Gfo/Idh/MocA family oxidoreductase [Bacteroidota bacterium]GGH74594.1 oxidoreductase [Phaeocystidibacter marisrubri]